jgi:hypothetical protein
LGDARTGDDQPGPDPDSPRVLDGLQVLYTFDEGKGLAVKDRSGVEPAFDLQLDNLVTSKWIEGGGIQLVGPASVITSPEVADKVFVACVQANAVTLEAWIEPAKIDQQGAILTYSKQGQRNATLSVSNTRYAGAVLTSRPDPMMPGQVIETTEVLQTPDNTAAPTVQHVLYTRDVDGAVLYVNGVDTKPPSTSTTPADPKPITDQTDWSPTYQLALGNESTGGSPWLGNIYLAAIYCKKLTPAEVVKNYGAGY